MKKEDRLAWKLHIDATNDQFEAKEICLGPWTSYSMVHDPKHMCFVLSRYKFCSRMLFGKNNVLEVGCGDGFGVPIMAQSVKKLHCIDWEERNIAGNFQRYDFLKNVSFECLDITETSPRGFYDAAINIDVLEHLEPEREDIFMNNICSTLVPSGVLIIGTPNKTASIYATKRSESQHINLKTGSDMRELMEKHFENCFIFSMNDEIVHTGYEAMAHYLFGIGVGLKTK